MIGGLPSLIYKMFFLQIGVFAMTATFFRFVVALLFWISFPLVIVAALAPEESTEFDGQRSQTLDCKRVMEECLMFVISEAGR